MLDQVYNTVLPEEVGHALDQRSPCFIKVHVQILNNNGLPEALQGLRKVRQVIQRQEWQVCSDKKGPSESGGDLAAYHVRPVVQYPNQRASP